MRYKQSIIYDEFEKDFCVNDIWDGRPICGVSLYIQEPHYFECIFDEEKDDWTDYYFLTPISQEVLKRVVENWNFWLGWMNSDSKIPHPSWYKDLRETKTKEEIKKEFDPNINKIDWYKAEKYYINQKVIAPFLTISETSIKAKGKFKRVFDGSWGYEERSPKLVKWVID